MYMMMKRRRRVRIKMLKDINWFRSSLSIKKRQTDAQKVMGKLSLVCKL